MMWASSWWMLDVCLEVLLIRGRRTAGKAIIWIMIRTNGKSGKKWTVPDLETQVWMSLKKPRGHVWSFIIIDLNNACYARIKLRCSPRNENTENSIGNARRVGQIAFIFRAKFKNSDCAEIFEHAVIQAWTSDPLLFFQAQIICESRPVYQKNYQHYFSNGRFWSPLIINFSTPRSDVCFRRHAETRNTRLQWRCELRCLGKVFVRCDYQLFWLERVTVESIAQIIPFQRSRKSWWIDFR
jgi:hypothetical protein